jgi:hypothetical protein
MNYFEQHPFLIVIFLTVIFMFFLTKDNIRAVRHRKHQIEIEKRKRQKNIKLKQD